MNRLLEKVSYAISEYSMASAGETLVCGLSGGADSVAMLISLKELGFSVTAVHVNHGLRGAESDGDEEFCRKLCAEMDIPLTVFHADVTGFAKEKSLGTEEAARILRYGFFEQAAGNSAKICTAHTLSDSAETVLFNLCRGTGVKGLCGIPPVRGNIIRPLIRCTREDVEDYLAEKGRSFVTDSTNLTDDYSRNKIRHGVIPVLREINGGFYSAVSSLTSACEEYEDFAEMSLKRAIAENVPLSDMHPLLRKKYIASRLEERNIPVNARRLTELSELVTKGGRIQLSGDIFAVCRGGRFEIREELSADIPEMRFPLKIGENEFLQGKKVIVKCSTDEIFKKNANVQSKLTKFALDCDKIQGEAFLRTRKNCGGIKLVGSGHTRSVKKLFNEYRPPLSAYERSRAVCIEDDNGLIWVERLGAADRVRADENSSSVWEIEVIYE